jgi:hypothetical protein
MATRKGKKGHPDGKKRIILSLLTDNMVLYMKSPEEFM